jgi:hypothetical protein
MTIRRVGRMESMGEFLRAWFNPPRAAVGAAPSPAGLAPGAPLVPPAGLAQQPVVDATTYRSQRADQKIHQLHLRVIQANNAYVARDYGRGPEVEYEDPYVKPLTQAEQAAMGARPTLPTENLRRGPLDAPLNDARMAAQADLPDVVRRGDV